MEENATLKEIQELIDESSNLHMDIYNYIIRMILSIGYSVSSTINRCLLEDGNSYPEERDQRISMRNGCMICLGKLVKLGVLGSNSKDGFFHENTIFHPVDTEKFNYLLYALSNAMREIDALRFGDFAVEEKIFDFEKAKKDRKKRDRSKDRRI
jgi:hypothetical protein